MNLNRIIQFFVTTENRFFPLYIEQADAINKAARYLSLLVNTIDAVQIEILNKQIKEQEVRGDVVLREFEKNLYNLSLTPFSREDVHELAELMDDLLDRLDDASNVILTHGYDSIDGDLIKMADNLVSATDSIVSITNCFTDIPKYGYNIVDYCKAVKDIEHANDEIYGDYITKLFAADTLSMTQIIKRRDIVQSLENATNTAKYITDKTRSIMAKMS